MAPEHVSYSTFASIAYGDFVEGTKKFSETYSVNGKIDLDATLSITKKAIEQSTYWYVKYILSPYISPDTVAKDEWRKYGILCKTLITNLDDACGNTKDLFLEIEQGHIIQFICMWNIEYYGSRPFKRTILQIIGKAAVFFRHLGIMKIAVFLRDIQYFPSWTIRRHSDIPYNSF